MKRPEKETYCNETSINGNFIMLFDDISLDKILNSFYTKYELINED